MNRIILENEFLTAIVYPDRGGKMGSIRFKSADFELLAQPKGGVYPPLRPGMPFHEGDASGFDDVFPSMGGETVNIQGELFDAPDHGQIWTAPMEANLSEGELRLCWDCDSLPYRYEKRIALKGSSIQCDYVIQNLSDHPLPCVWVCHCLMRHEEGQTFEFPSDARIARNLIPGTALGTLEQAHDVNASDYDFSRPPAPGSAIKFYFEQPVREGRCAVNYVRSGVRAEMRFDPEVLPYLGFWMTTGAYRGDCNFAFEPATGYYDTIGCAQRHGTLSQIAPGDALKFRLSIGLSRIEG